jgi:argininosuccinate lyase
VTWGGRFSAPPDEGMLAITASLGVDVELLEQELACTRAHARVLVGAGLLDGSAVEAIDRVCDEISHQDRDAARYSEDEDVHSLVERRLTEELGDLGARIHAGRSRNDLVATDLRLWCRTRSAEAASLVASVVDDICRLAERHVDTVMPGYTHLQPAQPVSLAFHLSAHGFALVRDAHRFQAAGRAADVCTLGAGAVAGTTLPLDVLIAAEELEFATSFENAMDAVSDRDFACDFCYAGALCLIHLSRMCEELVVWTSAEFGFARLSDTWSTGSSMMPQKRNPDVAELTRGRAATCTGELAGLLGLLKGLPLSYARDLQEDKSAVFSSWRKLRAGLIGIRGLLTHVEFDERRLAESARAGAMWATDLAEALAVRGVPFREAHRAVGRLIASLEGRGMALADATVDDLKDHHPALQPSDLRFADPSVGVRSRRGRGGPAPEQVREQIAALRAAAATFR